MLVDLKNLLSNGPGHTGYWLAIHYRLTGQSYYTNMLPYQFVLCNLQFSLLLRSNGCFALSETSSEISHQLATKSMTDFDEIGRKLQLVDEIVF